MMQQKCSISTLSNTGNRTNNWLQWKSNFIYYLEANNFTTKSEDLKIHLLKENIGEIGLKAIELLNEDSKTPINNIDTLLRKLDTYFHVPKNEIVERYNFFTTSQSKDQSIDAYILVLKKKAETCNFGTLTDSLIRDKVITVIEDKNLRKILFNADKLDLVKLITICHEYNDHMQTKNADSKNLSNEKIIQQKQQTEKYYGTKNTGINDQLKTNENRQTTTTTVFRKPCWKCNTYHAVQCCPAWRNKCMNCGDRNHYTYCCQLLKR